MQEALYYKKLNNNLQCILCPHFCVIEPGQYGKCGVRINIDQKLITLNYSKLIGLHVDPIEKKPLFHFLPGSQVMSFGTAGCNMSCLHCQNWHMSQKKVSDDSQRISPEEIVKLTLKHGCKVIAYTYNEPTIFFEFMLDCAKLARKNGIKNIMVSNGFINPEPLKELCQFIDGVNIDLKAFNDNFYKNICDARLEPVKNSLRTLKENGVWFEITNLIIPTKNDDMVEIEQMCKWIKGELGQGVPIHFSRFRPNYKLNSIQQTPKKTLESAKEIAEKYLDYVYVGNIWIENAENTYCPKCKALVVKRDGYNVVMNEITNSKCECGQKIDGVWT